MSPRFPAVSSPQSGPCVGVVGDVYRILVSGEQTAGAYSVVEAIVPPGSGPPPHRHSREDEGFYVLEGELTITVDGRRETLSPGMFGNLPVGSLHFFRNEGSVPVRMLITVAPAGFEQMFMEVGVPLPPGSKSAPPPSHDDIARLLEASNRYGVEIQPPG
ncbi:cupin domain-containing protein [Caulifigura coniformis]|nr:cupin domain-containing protein [Caulifigura coniformis]